MLKNSVAPLLTLDPALSSMDYGQAVTVTATLPADADGTIDFMDGSTVLATLPLVNGSASYSLAQLGVAPSAHSISAVYSGNAQHYTASTSESVLLTVTKATVGIQLTSTPNPSTLDDNVTFTAAMTPAATSGTITFKDGETVLRSVPITNGIASFNYFALAAGMHTISATYDGNANTGTASAALQHTVGLDLHQLQTTVNGSGSVHGSAWSLTVGSPSDIACTDNSGTCSALYPAWDVVDLMATGGAASLFDSWSGDCAGKISSCSVIVDGSKPVTSVGANFIPAPLAKNSTKDVAYPTLSAALSAANSVTTDDLLLLGIGYDGAVTLSKGINFKGGWNPLYLNLTGVWTILNNGLTVESGDSSLETIGVIGKLTVKGGKVTAKGVKVK